MSLITARSNGAGNRYSIVEDILIVKWANEKKTIEQIQTNLKSFGFDRTDSSLQYRTGKRCLRKPGITLEALHKVDKTTVAAAQKEAETLLSGKAPKATKPVKSDATEAPVATK